MQCRYPFNSLRYAIKQEHVNLFNVVIEKLPKLCEEAESLAVAIDTADSNPYYLTSILDRLSKCENVVGRNSFNSALKLCAEQNADFTTNYLRTLKFVQVDDVKVNSAAQEKVELVGDLYIHNFDWNYNWAGITDKAGKTYSSF